MTPTEHLAEALAPGDPRATARAVEALVNYQIYRATGRTIPEAYVNHSRTNLVYRD
jgi:hypothetical protein